MSAQKVMGKKQTSAGIGLRSGCVHQVSLPDESCPAGREDKTSSQLVEDQGQPETQLCQDYRLEQVVTLY